MRRSTFAIVGASSPDTGAEAGVAAETVASASAHQTKARSSQRKRPTYMNKDACACQGHKSNLATDQAQEALSQSTQDSDNQPLALSRLVLETKAPVSNYGDPVVEIMGMPWRAMEGAFFLEAPPQPIPPLGLLLAGFRHVQ